MIRSQKTYAFWANHITSNPFPAMTVPNFSLAKTATSLAIYVPLHLGEDNVNFVAKEKPPEKSGGEAMDLIKPHFSMVGSGLSSDDIAFLHPIKVLKLLNNMILFYCFFRCHVPSCLLWEFRRMIR